MSYTLEVFVLMSVSQQHMLYPQLSFSINSVLVFFMPFFLSLCYDV